MSQAQYKKVLSEGCFAAHLLFFSCAVFGLMVSRDYLGDGAKVSGGGFDSFAKCEYNVRHD